MKKWLLYIIGCFLFSLGGPVGIGSILFVVIVGLSVEPILKLLEGKYSL